MGQIHQKDFSAGYTPGDDVNNGRPNGLLRMDNLWLDQYGSVSLTRFAEQLSVPNSPLGVGAFIYSKFLFNGKNRYIGLANGILQRAVVGQPFINVITGGSNHFACGTGFGQVFCTSGQKHVKDDGVSIKTWGINPPAGPPSAFNVDGAAFAFYGSDSAHYTSFTAVEGAVTSSANGLVNFTLDTTTKRAVIQYLASLNLSISLDDGESGTETDIFSVAVLLEDSATVQSVRVEALLQTPGGGTPDVTDYFYYEWDSPNSNFKGGKAQWSILTCQRQNFSRAGNSSKGWESTKGVRVIVTSGVAAGAYAIGIPFSFKGGNLNQLVGGYNNLPPYVYYQANVYNNGNYIGISPLGPPSAAISVISGNVSFNPYTIGADPQVTEYWIYKTGGLLQRPYLVAQITAKPGRGVGNKDNHPDQYYIENGITANVFLASIGSIPDEIIGIAGPIAGRLLLLTTNSIYFTDYLNPETYDTRLVLKTSGSAGEKNLFITTTGANTCVVGTTGDFYQISGTFQQLPDGTFDFIISPLGIKQPPISESFVCYNSAIIYIALDGIREMFASVTNVISHELDVFWRRLDCFGVRGFLIQGGNLTTNMRLGYLPGKLLLSMVHLDNTQSVFEYDLGKKYWYRRVLGVDYFCTEDDGNCLAACSDGFLRDYDIGQFLDNTPQPIRLQSSLRDGGEPLQRKDLFTLKVEMQGGPVDVSLYTEDNTTVNLGSYILNVGGTVNIPVNGTAINLYKRYGIIISGDSVPLFSLKDWSLDYEARPLQQTYLRVMPSEFQIAGRKRVATIPIVIDTLGLDVIMQPLIDGVLKAPQTVNTTFKQTFIYQFNGAANGYDIGFVLSSPTNNVFEYYYTIPPRNVDLLPDLTGYLFIPASDFGTAAKKRIRTIPLVIDTHGSNVRFIPRVDGVDVLPAQIFNTSGKTTVYYFFTEDSFGIDYGGQLVLQSPNVGVSTPNETGFEFFGFGAPVDVETLPPPKLLDQLGPMQLDRMGKLLEFRIRVLSQTTSLSYTVFMDDVGVYSGSFSTSPNIDTVYQIKTPRGVLGKVCRVVISSPDNTKPFYRWYAQFRTQLSGMETANKWIMAAGSLQRTLGEGNK